MTIYNRQDDIAAWNKWKTTGAREDLGVLFNRMEPVIQKEVSRWASGPAARPVLNLEAKKISLKAFVRNLRLIILLTDYFCQLLL